MLLACTFSVLSLACISIPAFLLARKSILSRPAISSAFRSDGFLLSSRSSYCLIHALLCALSARLFGHPVVSLCKTKVTALFHAVVSFLSPRILQPLIPNFTDSTFSVVPKRPLCSCRLSSFCYCFASHSVAEPVLCSALLLRINLRSDLSYNVVNTPIFYYPSPLTRSHS